MSATLSENKVANITARAISEAQRELTDVEKIICKQYMSEDHLRSITVASKMMGVAISFRPAGEASLKRQAEGAPTKGHDILEKTVKLSKLEEVYGKAAAQTRLEQMEKNDIDGFVGHWGEHGLLGLYVDPDAEKNENLAPFLEKLPDGKLYYPIDHDKLEESLAPLRAHEPDWKKKVLTGDCDIHDMINLQGNRSPITAGSADEQRVRQAINTAVAATDPNRPLDAPAMAIVQHGPQYNYVAYMKSIESGKPIDDNVARPSLPVAMCVRGTWSIISTEKELGKFYKSLGVEIKDGWNAGDTGSRRSSLAGPHSNESSPAPSRRGSMQTQARAQADGRRPSLPLIFARRNSVQPLDPAVQFSDPFAGAPRPLPLRRGSTQSNLSAPTAQTSFPSFTNPFASSFTPSSLSQVASTVDDEHVSDSGTAGNDATRTG
ncbi:hypothetical protein [Paraburkholderia sp.]|uniref:hypothetical protein n=1 Tax=Paraburkholderia sp. TaxID=1926495 RepID=UPI003D6FBCD0